MSFRDVQILFAETLDQKQDRRSWVPAVITDAAGNQSGSGSVWFNQAERKVWCMPLGGTQPAPKFCPSGLEPVIGLGVILGYPEGSREQQILRADDDFFQRSNLEPSSFSALTAADLAPGGKQFLWLQSKALMPLAVWPFSGLTIRVNPGEYGYMGARKTFGGITYNLTSSKPSAGQHRLVGLYLDSSNAFQIVNGTAVSTSTIPPAPAWPYGAFRLATVKLAGSSTSLDFANDFTDQRLLWDLVVGGWPAAGRAMINSTEYATITAALAAASDGDIIKLGQGTFSEYLIINKSVSLVALSAGSVITSANSPTIYVTGAAGPVRIIGPKIINTGGGSDAGCVGADSPVILDRCILEKASGSPTTGYGLWLVSGSGHALLDTEITATAGTSKYGVLADTSASDLLITGGRIEGTTKDIYLNHASAVVQLNDPLLANAAYQVAAGTLQGWFYDASSNHVAVNPIDPSGHIHSQVWESDGGAVAWQTDASGNLIGQGAIGVGDIRPQQDAGGLWIRYVNYGVTPEEHWKAGAADSTWTGWASYTGFATPSTQQYSNSLFAFFHSSTARKFLYKPFINGQTLLRARAAITSGGEAGVMVDDGVNNADGLGANNFVRWFIEGGSGNWNFAMERRAGGGAVTKTTFGSLPPSQMYGIALHYGVGTRWTNWTAVAYSIGESTAFAATVLTSVAGLAWTPARHGLYGGPATNSRAIFDWFLGALG